MASRIEWVRLRLENWARWHAQRESGGLGYPKQATFVRLAAHGARAEAVIPIDSVEASVTDDAVKALQFTHSDLHVTVCCIYLQGVGVQEAARRLARARSTILARLAQADQQLAIWFRERAAVRQRMSFTP